MPEPALSRRGGIVIPYVDHFVKGYVRLRICGNSPNRFINLCSFHGMCLWDIVPCGGGYEFYMTVKDFKRIRPIAGKTRSKVSVTEKRGLPFFIYRNRRRKVFFGGVILCILLLRLFSGLLWDIQFKGNLAVSDDTMLSFFQEQGVKLPMPLMDVNCEALEAALREKFDEIVWTSVSLEGCVLAVNIKEDENPSFKPESGIFQPPANIVAKKDGVITKMITRKGTPLVHVGDKVTAGDVLVSGKIDLINDSQEVCGSRYVAADADISADTVEQYKDVISMSYGKKNYGTDKNPWKRRRAQCFFQAGPVRLCLGLPGEKFPQKEIMTKEYSLKLGENFHLPVKFGFKVYRAYTLKPARYTKEEVQRLLGRDYRLFCEELKEKGIQILENNVKIYINKDRAAAAGTLRLNEEIGERAQARDAERNIDDGSGTDND